MPERTNTVTDDLPSPIRVLVVAGTGMLRAEIAEAFDDDFVVAGAADAPKAAEVAATGVHVAVVVGDDLYNCSMEDVMARVRLAAPESYRVAVLLLNAHGDLGDVSAPFHWGADDVARWPIDADMFRARVRSLVRVSMLEAAMGRVADAGHATTGDLQHALGVAVHLVNNAVAGISGRAQLATLTGAPDEAGLVPICLAEARKMSVVLGALHRLAESLPVDDEELADDLAGLLATTGPVAG